MKRLKCESRRCCSQPTPYPTPPSPRRSSRVSSSSSSVHSAEEEEVVRPSSSFHTQGDHPQPSAVALLPVVYVNPAHARFSVDGRWVVGGEEEGCCDQNEQNCSPCHHPLYHPRYHPGYHRPSTVPSFPYCGYDSRCQRQAHLLSHMYYNNAFSHPPPSTWYPSHGHHYGHHGHHGHHHGRKWSDMPHCNQAGVGWGWRGC